MTAYNAIMRDLLDRKFYPVYLLMGEESYYIDKVADYIAHNVLTEEERDFNQTVLFGSDYTAAQIVDAARRYPMMAEHQVIIVKEAQDIKIDEEGGPLAKYLERPMTQTVLVICYKNGKLDKRKTLYKVFAEAENKHKAVIMESLKIKDWQLPNFIEQYLKEKGININRKAKLIIAENVGADLSRLTGELDKLIISLEGNNKTVTPEVVEQVIGVNKEYNVLEFRNAIINHDIMKAEKIMKYFNNDPRNKKAGGYYQFIPILFKYFRNLMIAHYAPQKTEQAVATILGLKSQWQAKDYIIGINNYSKTKTLNIIHKLRETDAKSKGIDNPSTNIAELAKELIFYILH